MSNDGYAMKSDVLINGKSLARLAGCCCCSNQCDCGCVTECPVHEEPPR